MSNIDFPSSPSVGSLYAADSRLWRFNGSQWALVPYGTDGAANGSVDGGSPSIVAGRAKANGGAAASNFSGTTAINGGTV